MQTCITEMSGKDLVVCGALNGKFGPSLTAIERMILLQS
jgi:hypothetical protein